MKILRKDFNYLIIVVALSFVYALLMAQFPFGYGFDYGNYLIMFNDIENSRGIFSAISTLRYEPLSILAIHFFGMFKVWLFNYFALFIFFSLIFKLLAVGILRASFFTFVLIYFLKYAPLYDVNQFRAGLGLSFCCLSFAYLIKRNDLAFILFGIGAFFLHFSSAIPLIIFIMFWVFRADCKAKVVTIILAAICVYFFQDMAIAGIQNSIAVYKIIAPFNPNSKIISPMVIFEVLAIIIYLKSKLVEKNIFIGLSLFGIIGYFFLLYNQMPYGYRFLETTSFFQPVFLGMIYSSEPNSRVRINLYIVAIGIYSVRYWQSLVSI